jgi:intergrase/recombinase
VLEKNNSKNKYQKGFRNLIFYFGIKFCTIKVWEEMFTYVQNVPFSDGKLYLPSIDLHKSRGLSFVDNGIMDGQEMSCHMT